MQSNKISTISMLKLMHEADATEAQAFNNYWEYIFLKNNPDKQELEKCQEKIEFMRRSIKRISDYCSHPFGVSYGGTTYCPICNKILPENAPKFVITVSNYKGLLSIKQELEKLLSRESELSIEEIVNYLRNLKLSEEKFAR